MAGRHLVPDLRRQRPGAAQRRAWSDNVAYASFAGFLVRFHNTPATRLLIPEEPFEGHAVYDVSTFTNLTAWNNEVGLSLSYTVNARLVHARALTAQACAQGDVGLEAPQLTCVAIDSGKSMDAHSSVTRFEQMEIAGYHHAIDVYRAGESFPDFCADGAASGTLAGQAIRWGGHWLAWPLSRTCWP
jgi:hypothetical protein